MTSHHSKSSDEEFNINEDHGDTPNEHGHSNDFPVHDATNIQPASGPHRSPDITHFFPDHEKVKDHNVCSVCM